jgi:hypothetical protein
MPPIKDINEFLKFYDNMPDEEINAALDEFKPDESNTETVYAKDYIEFIEETKVVQIIPIDLAFLVLKSDNRVFSAVQIRSIYDIVGFKCPVGSNNFEEQWDWEIHYLKECEIRHLPQETEYFKIIYNTVNIGVNPFQL